jgi:glyoxylase-like metal-dependent hydrolase (beta-lactamase superfamily II)
MKIHAVRTGTVRVHERQRAGEGRGVLRFVRTLLDDDWTEPLPIFVWVIEHPEGVIVVDTGETARTGDPGYLPRWHPYFRLAMRTEVAPHEEIGPRLRSLGIPPAEVDTVVLTHLHTDHAGGLHHFPRNEILVPRVEHGGATGLPGRLRGYLPHRWPDGFAPTLVDFDPEPLGPFPESFSLTADGAVRMVPTPGHTAGHASVVVDEGDRLVFLAGDASYTASHLVRGRVDGVASVGGGEAVARRTLQRIRDLATLRPLVYLPSHDPNAGRRLQERAVVGVEGADQPSVTITRSWPRRTWEASTLGSSVRR